MTKHSAIAIVGAGIAGLNAALTLQDAGVESSIYEASNHIGGRMHSDDTTWGDGMVSEWCGEFVDDDHDVIHGLVKRFGLQTVELELQGAQEQRILYFANHYRSAEEMDRETASLAPILQKQVQEAGFPTTHTHFTETGYQLDHLSVYDWVERYVKGGHNTLLGKLMDSACKGFYGAETSEQSSLNLVYMFGEQMVQNNTALVRPVPGSSKIIGGNQQLPLAIASHLPASSLHLNHRLVAIKRNDDDTIALRLATCDGIIEATYDHVILTLPFSTLRNVDYREAGFDSLKQTAITQLGYGSVSKLCIQFDSRYWYQEGPWPTPNNGFIITDLNIQTLWDTARGQNGVRGMLVDYTSGRTGASYAPPAPYLSTADSEVVQDYAKQAVQELERVFPGIGQHYTGRAALSYPTGDPNLHGSYSYWRVGQYTLFGGYERVRQGNIHFAGEHCSVEWQGFMEGGASEGRRVAREVLQDYGRHEQRDGK